MLQLPDSIFLGCIRICNIPSTRIVIYRIHVRKRAELEATVSDYRAAAVSGGTLLETSFRSGAVCS